jgi:hypothetical protein
VQRACHRRPPRAARLLLAACLALGCREAGAQTAMVFADPFAPRLESNPDNPPRFEQQSQPARRPARPQFGFTPPVSGAGLTGFDSTNARTKTKAKRKPRATATAAPPPPSPYQVPQIPAADAGTSALAAAPGSPPVEEIRPIRKLPPKRKAHAEPVDAYAPLGIRAGAFDLFPAIELLGGYDTNPGQNKNPKAAWLYTVAPELKVQSDWSRHELKADLRGSYTGYSPDEIPTLSRPHLDGKVDGRIDVSRQTRVDLSGRALVATDNPGSPNLQAGLAKLPLYFAFGGGAGLGQRFNRFELSIKGDAERTVYQNSELTDGSIASNKDRNYNQYTGTLRGGYELLPGVTPFAEVSADTRVHDLETDFSGYQRDSKGLTGKVGSTFKLSHALAGEIALGYTKRTYDDPRLENLTGLIGDASLVWTASALTTVKLTGSSTVGESTQAGVSGVLYRNVGVQVDHAFRQWLIGSVKAGFGDDDYIGDSRNDKRYSVGAGLTYKFSREFQLKGEFRQTWQRSNVSGGDYNESVFLLGLRIQR